MVITQVVSVAIIAHRSIKNLYRTVDSVLSQSDPEIELIVQLNQRHESYAKQINNYIEKNFSSKPIQTYISICPNEYTPVQAANAALNSCHGEYVVLLDCGDNFVSSETIGHYREAIIGSAEKVSLLVSQVEVCHDETEEFLYYAISPQQRIAMESKDSEKTLKEFIKDFSGFTMLGACLLKDEFLKMGGFNQQFTTMYDIPFIYSLLEKGEILAYANFVSIHHYKTENDQSNELGIDSNDWSLRDLLLITHKLLPISRKFYKGNLQDPYWRFSYFKLKYLQGETTKRILFRRGMKGKIQYALRHPLYAGLKISYRVYPYAAKLSPTMLMFSLLMFTFGNDCGELLCYFLPEASPVILSLLSLSALFSIAISFTLYGFCALIMALKYLENAPKQALDYYG